MHVGTLHYRCGFFVRLQKNSRQVNLWQELLGQIRNWAAYQPKIYNVPTSVLSERWFENGGSEAMGPFLIRTAYAKKHESPNRVWALSHQQPDRNYPFRKWDTYIGLYEYDSENVFFQVQTTYNIDANYLGDLPPAPEPTTPNIVTRILKSCYLTGYSGDAELSENAIPLKLGDGFRFREHIDNHSRCCPVILVTPERESGDYLINVDRLAKLLKGAAQVFVVPPHDDELLEELKEMLGRKLFTYDGSVRLYLQGVNNNLPKASLRHRFVSAKALRESGEIKAEQLFSSAVLRKNLHYYNSYPLSPDEVISFSRKQRIIELKNRQEKDMSSADEIRSLNEILLEEVETLQNEVNKERSSSETWQSLCEEFESSNTKLDFKVKNLQHKLIEKKQGNPSANIINSCFHNYPTTLEEALCWFRELFPGHIVFTDEALKSLESSTFKDIGVFWHTLRTMHSFLWEWCIAGNRQGNIEQEFERLTGRRLAMAESQSTQKHKALMSDRKITYQECEIDITPHIKLDDDTTRIYWGACMEKQVLVIGFVGHMNTAGTRRRGKR